MTEAGDPLGAFLASEIRRGAMPSAVWWVGDSDRVVASGAVGHAALEPDPDPVRSETPFDLASLTKPLATALLATMLDHEGRLRLDASLGETFPELLSTPFGAESLRDVAAHRAGFPAWAALHATASGKQGYLAAIASCQRPHAPGTTVYSDLGYILLGLAVEKAGGAPLERLFADRIAAPLGLGRCGFAGRGGAFADAAATERGNAYERALAGPVAPGNRFREEIPRGQVHDGNAWGLGGVAGHAGLFGTAKDVAAIALAILHPTRFGLPPSTLDPMLHPVAAGPAVRTVGFVRAPDAESVEGVLPDVSVGHSGFTGTSLWIDPMRPRVFVLLTNRVHPRVPSVPFVTTRREFHRLAAGL